MVTSILHHLSAKFSDLTAYKSLKQKVNNGKVYITGLNQTGKLLVLSQIRQDTDKKIIYVVKNESEQAAIKQDLEQLTDTPVYTYPNLKSERINRKEYISDFLERANATAALTQKQPGIFIFPVKSLIEPLTSPASANSLKIGCEYNPEELLTNSITNGYERQTKVFQSGEIAMRGGNLDIFALGNGYPYRLEFNGNRLEKISEFDPVSAVTRKQLEQIKIPAIKSAKINQYLLELIEPDPKPYLLIFHQADELFQMLYELYQGSNNNRDNTILTTVSKQLDILPAWHFVSIPPTERDLIRFDLASAPLFANDLNRMANEIKKYDTKNYQIILATEKGKQLLPVLLDHKISMGDTPTDKLALIEGRVPEGFMSAALKIILLTDTEIFAPITEKTGHSKKTPRRRQLAFLAGIEKGDYVVHADHGIGKLVEIGTMTVNDISREYLTIQYAGADKIYVPVDQIDKISKYVSVAGEKPVLSKLSSQGWKRLVSRIKKESQEFAKELLDLYAKRALHQGIAFEGGEFWEKALADSFAFEETPDQEQVIQDILGDMEGSKPMDRLLVADVGFGKTEVAVRAAFKAVTAGYQVAVLAPTTILVEQHLKTFTERLSPFGTQVAALSRFRSTKEQKRIVTGLKTREVDIVVGTHRLLSPDIKFANLGLIIIDEEQRFGVRHKEKLKMMRSEVDVLSLTATPIPRTLNLALSGIRDISTIETPPINRLPIQTTVAPFDMDAVKEAILNEIRRGGQVYFVHNRVATIASITNKLKEVLPEVRFVYAHGQMPERLLAKIMEDFRQGKYDCLVASTIIENGLDNPNVNTLIVDNAGNFGLSQLHQLRGRIGRGKIQAYAYFYYSAGKLSGKALERLKTIAGHTELGSGYQIALRDLQIRGAGGVLSKRQHGHISAVGLTMYTKLLNRAIEELKTGYRPQVDTITVDLPISAYLPTSYIDNEAQRIKTYQQLALVEDEKEMKEALAEMQEKFGELPKEVQNLFDLLKLKLLALDTQKINSIIARNIAPSNKPVEYLCNIMLTNVLKDKNVIGALENIGAKVSDNLVKLPLAGLGANWVDGLKKVINLLK
ncbi:transcription-repair coupling factor [Patescibacteria group bacterium]|nr:transcription-repair coupling factor [Patescibacteria group bacterium]